MKKILLAAAALALGVQGALAARFDADCSIPGEPVTIMYIPDFPLGIGWVEQGAKRFALKVQLHDDKTGKILFASPNGNVYVTGPYEQVRIDPKTAVVTHMHCVNPLSAGEK